MKKYFAGALMVVLFMSTAAGAQATPRITPPDGFEWYYVNPGDTLSVIALQHHWDIIRRVNGMDEKHLQAGRYILVPIEGQEDVARRYVPVPVRLSYYRSTPRVIYVNIRQQKFGAYEYGRLIYWGPISSGADGKDTPKGRFTVKFKDKDHISSINGAQMPYAINFKPMYFLHQQTLSGKRSSRGCVRLLQEDAKRTFYWLRVGDPIEIE